MDLIAALIGWVIFGLIVGAIARLLIPGRDPMGWVVTILLGVVGAVVGGLIGWALGLTAHPSAPGGLIGWILSILGAVLVLLLYYWATGSRRYGRM